MVKKIKLNNFPTNPIGEITSNQMELFVIETEATEEAEAAVTMLIKTKSGKYQLALEMIEDATFNAYFGIEEEEEAPVVEDEEETTGDEEETTGDEEETPGAPEPGEGDGDGEPAV